MMNIYGELDFNKIFLQAITANWLKDTDTVLDVLRLDVMHPVVSGNKWFKLKYYLEDAKKKNFDTVATFGGAYSNHIIATAFACKLSGLKSIGIIRGEEPETLSHTLVEAKQLGMDIRFISRNNYKNFDIDSLKNNYVIEEGGYGEKGAKGISEISFYVKNLQQYSHIVCAVGTGTTLAGIVQLCLPDQKIIGISVMKGNTELVQKITKLLPEEKQNKFTIMQDFHFGGYAKHTKQLLDYMNKKWQLHHLPTDFVYTAKTFFAVEQMIAEKIIPAKSRVLMIHTGGLQGNLSLPKNTLQF